MCAQAKANVLNKVKDGSFSSSFTNYINSPFGTYGSFTPNVVKLTIRNQHVMHNNTIISRSMNMNIVFKTISFTTEHKQQN